MTKLCRGCGQERELSAFHHHRGRSDGLQSRCKACQKAYTYQWRAENPDKVKAITRRSWVHRGQHRQREKLYGMTREDYESLLSAQRGSCAICGDSPDTLQVDHDHTTDLVRGLLCLLCNTGLGKFRDTPDLLRAAAHYLEASSEHSQAA